MPRKKIKYKKPTLIDHFCGCGGISLGFEEAGFSILAGLDNWELAMETFQYNFPKAKSYCKKIEEMTPGKILNDLGLKIGELDVLVGGPPCQGFSLAGDRNHDDQRNNLVFRFIETIKSMQPKAFLMENVLGILSMRNGKVKNKILEGFEAAGYNVEVEDLYAHHFGVPQMRRRVFFIGNRIGRPIIWPTQTHWDLRNNSNRLVAFKKIKPFITVGEAISDLPLLDNDKGEEAVNYCNLPNSDYQKKMRRLSQKIYNHVASNHSDQTRKVIAYVPEGGNWRDLPKKFQNIIKL